MLHCFVRIETISTATPPPPTRTQHSTNDAQNRFVALSFFSTKISVSPFLFRISGRLFSALLAASGKTLCKTMACRFRFKTVCVCFFGGKNCFPTAFFHPPRSHLHHSPPCMLLPPLPCQPQPKLQLQPQPQRRPPLLQRSPWWRRRKKANLRPALRTARNSCWLTHTSVPNDPKPYVPCIVLP